MKIGVISDTHDQVAHILQMVEILNVKQVALVIHCGDWVAPFTLQFYLGLKCPIKGIFGNNDGDKFRHVTRTANYPIKVEYEERFMTLDLDGKKIAVFHGDYTEIVDALVKCGSYDAVFHGHTHERVNEMVGKTLSLNPGSLMDMTSSEIKGASFAIYDTKTNAAEFVYL